MKRVRASCVINVPEERAWTALARYDRWSSWGVSITGVEIDGEVVRVGARGHVRTKLGVRLPFLITEVVPGRSWRWSVGGIDATDHVVEPHVRGCRVTFTAPWWALPYQLVLRAALSELAAALE